MHCKFGSYSQEIIQNKPNLSSSGWDIPSSWPRPSFCLDSSQFHYPEPANRGLWVEVNCPLYTEHPVRQTIVLHSVCVCVCICVWGGTWCIVWDERKILSSNYLQVTSWNSRQKQNIELTLDQKKEKVGTQLVKREWKTNNFSWTLGRKIRPKLTKWLKWKGNSELFSKKPHFFFL